MSLFSLKADSHPGGGVGATPEGSSSGSVGGLGSGIDQLDEVGPEGTSMVPMQNPRRDQVSHSPADPREMRIMGEGSSRADRGAPGSSSTPPRVSGGGSVKNKAARILVDASGAILS
jgi:hypothetical protein